MTIALTLMHQTIYIGRDQDLFKRRNVHFNEPATTFDFELASARRRGEVRDLYKSTIVCLWTLQNFRNLCLILCYCDRFGI